MRKRTVNMLTLYMAVGALLNSLALWLLFELDISGDETILTIVAVSACYILIARDISIKHEIICSGKKHYDYEQNERRKGA